MSTAYRRSCYTSLMLFLFLGLISCGTLPAVVELSFEADTETELASLKIDLAKGTRDHLAVLSPHNFAWAKDLFVRAESAKEDHVERRRVLHCIATSRAYLNRAREVAQISGLLLAQAIEQRNQAISSKAPQHLPNEFESIDEKLKLTTESIEQSDTSDALELREDLVRRYSHISQKSKSIINSAESHIDSP